MTGPMRHVDLISYFLGDLPAEHVADVEKHVAACAECRKEVESVREMRTMVGEIPPELALDGPPDGGDLLLQRTLRQVRTESARSRRTRGTLVGVAAAVAAVAVLGAGFVAGQATGGDTQPSATAMTPGTKVVSATDADTGARLSASVVPRQGWVQVNVAVTGLPVGEKCRMYVIDRDGHRETAISWVVSGKGSPLAGTALIDPAEVARLQVENVDGDRFVTADL